MFESINRSSRTLLIVALLLTIVAVCSFLGARRTQAVVSPVADASSIAAPGPCGCKHLKALQAELRNAIKLQAAFRGKINELRGMSHDTSVIALQR